MQQRLCCWWLLACKHAFKTYPKLPVGLGGMLQADVDSQPQQQQIFLNF